MPATGQGHRFDIIACVQNHVLSKRNAKIVGHIPCFDAPNGCFAQFHQGDRFKCTSSTGKYVPEDPTGESLEVNGLVYATTSSPFGKQLMVRFLTFLKTKQDAYQEILIVTRTMPTKQVKADLENLSRKQGVNIDIFSHDEIAIDRTVNVSVPKYQLYTKEKALQNILVSKNKRDLELLPTIFRPYDVVARVLFRHGDYVLVEDPHGTQLKRIVDFT